MSVKAMATISDNKLMMMMMMMNTQKVQSRARCAQVQSLCHGYADFPFLAEAWIPV
jgi:hypothetical protein